METKGKKIFEFLKKANWFYLEQKKMVKLYLVICFPTVIVENMIV